jgi:hypothetical protein
VRYGLRRPDLHATLDGLAIKLALALGGWVAFQPIGRTNGRARGHGLADRNHLPLSVRPKWLGMQQVTLIGPTW